LLAGKYADYEKLKSSLKSYPLYGYLEFEELERSVATAGDDKIESFLQDYADTPLADRLRREWLKTLAEQERFEKFYEVFTDNDKGNSTLHCQYLHAAIKLRKDVLSEIRDTWLTGKTLPDACVPVFDTLYESYLMTPDLVWERLALAMNRSNRNLADFLAKKLSASDRVWYDLWKTMDREPQKTLASIVDKNDHEKLRQIIVFGVKDYARQADTAAEVWNVWQSELKNRFSFSADEIGEVERNLALRAAWRHQADAQQLLAALAPEAVNEEVRSWRVRTALRLQDWEDALAQINALKPNEQQELEWRYWKARAYENIGRKVTALTIYKELAKETDYYGFLAAEKVSQDYRFNNEPAVNDTEKDQLASLAKKPVLMRVRELESIGWDTEAQQEWNAALELFDKEEKRLAAKLAQQWDMHFNAILTVARAGHFDDLDLRFPLLHQNIISREASRQRLEPAWVYGVIRRESAWRENVRSPAGALGLMQLMPATANQVSRSQGNKKRLSTSQILEVPRNISLGTAYLRQVMNQYGDHEILATASYNAGPHRVKQWLPENETMPADVWVDSIPFDETRNYVKAVMSYSTIADWKLGGKVRTLGERMETIRPLEQIKVASR
jgi:soluble lytic murein transglycosylase